MLTSLTNVKSCKVVFLRSSSYLKSKPEKDRTGKVKSKAMSVNELYERTSYNVYAQDQIIKSVEKLNDLLFKFDISKVTEKQKIRKVLQELRETIDTILRV